MTTSRATRTITRITLRAGGVVLAASFLAGFGLAPAAANAKPAAKVAICHATSSASNPYIKLLVRTTTLDGVGKNDHTGHTGGVFDFSDPDGDTAWGDIIPAAEGVAYSLNITEDGLGILANGCNGPHEGSCPDGLDPVGGDCSTEETCPNGQPASGGECDEDEEIVLCETDAALDADDPECGEVDGGGDDVVVVDGGTDGGTDDGGTDDGGTDGGSDGDDPVVVDGGTDDGGTDGGSDGGSDGDDDGGTDGGSDGGSDGDDDGGTDGGSDGGSDGDDVVVVDGGTDGGSDGDDVVVDDGGADDGTDGEVPGCQVDCEQQVTEVTETSQGDATSAIPTEVKGSVTLPTSSASSLPRTGASPIPMVQLALALILVGGVLMASRRAFGLRG